MDVLGFHHLALKVHDVEGIARFYREVLGLKEQQRHHRDDGSLRSIWLEVPGAGFLAVEALSTGGAAPAVSEWPEEPPGWFLLALKISPQARAAVEAELTRRQIPIVHRTKWTLYLRDPEGNRVGLSHHPYDATQG